MARDGGPGRGARAVLPFLRVPRTAGRTPLRAAGGAPAGPHPYREAVPQPLDDPLPERIRGPSPHGWFELFCCSGLVIVLVGGLILVALLVR
ncbi:MAG: hypothetical protein JWM18_1629 [Chloroflexi bacterium]|nr:hypothetical protein [Chloroflexota bacterium]